MAHAKNYEIMSTFVEVMQKTVASFYGQSVTDMQYAIDLRLQVYFFF